MDGHDALANVQTLGRCLSQLTTGDPCPWCGARLALRAVAQTRGPGSAKTWGESEKVVLSCGGCGCEISADDGADDSRSVKPFSVAA